MDSEFSMKVNMYEYEYKTFQSNEWFIHECVIIEHAISTQIRKVSTSSKSFYDYTYFWSTTSCLYD